MKPKIYLKFDKDLVLEGQYEESIIIEQMPLPMAISDMIDIINKLKKGQWVQIGNYYYVHFNPQNVNIQGSFRKAESH